jgi:uncharacterized protein involved in exopolysaccharide biosynthesis
MHNDLPVHEAGGRVSHYVDDEGPGLMDVLAILGKHLRLLVAGPLAAGLIAIAYTYWVAPTFTAVTTFLPPQQQQGVNTSLLASLGPLANLAGANPAALRTPADQYVALMQSATVSDRIVADFKLMQEYGVDYRVDARRRLAGAVRITANRKDGLITVEVDDKRPDRAAEMANRYVDELRRMTSTIAVTEAQQRRLFFEHQLQQTRDRLADAQRALQASGFSQGALKAEPKAAAEGYARLQAEVTAAAVRLEAMRRNLADETPEVQQQQATLAALRGQLDRLERATDINKGGPDYVGKYREFKYQETLFELYSRQFELARVDESREGSLIQVVDAATPPERRSKPKRAITAIVTTLAAFVAFAAFVLMRDAWRKRRVQQASRTIEQ